MLGVLIILYQVNCSENNPIEFYKSMNRIIRMLFSVLTVSVISLALGCGPQEDPSLPSAGGDASEAGATVAATPAEASPQTDPAATAPAAPPAPAFSGEVSSEGLPMKDEDDQPLDTLAALQYAVDTYERLRGMDGPDDEEEAKTWKPMPEITDLQQLVRYRLIRAVPQAPAGKKYVYDPQTRKVSLAGQ
jgi:hypothetical protein